MVIFRDELSIPYQFSWLFKRMIKHPQTNARRSGLAFDIKCSHWGWSRFASLDVTLEFALCLHEFDDPMNQPTVIKRYLAQLPTA
jgi:hypothetical protein